MKRDPGHLQNLNEKTRIAGVRDRFLPTGGDDTPLTPALFEELERQRAVRSDLAAVAIVATWRHEDGRHHVQSMLRFLDGDVPLALSLGRHTSCDIADIPGAALRHAVLVVHGGASPSVEAIDMRTGIGFFVGEATPANRVEGTSAVRFGVGSAEVIVLPSGPGTKLLPRGLEGLAQGEARQVRAQPREDERFLGRLLERSVVWAQRPPEVSRMEALDALQSRATSFFRSAPRVRGTTSPIVIDVTAAEVVEGVLLGRYPRCRGADALPYEKNVSRVHALVIERRGRTWIVDAGSTWGTVVKTAEGRVKAKLVAPGRVAQLDEGDRVFLGDCEVQLVVDGLVPNVPRGLA